MAWREYRSLWQHRGSRRLFVGYGVLLIWILTGVFLLRNLSGGGWHGDHYEHFERALFFLGLLPKDHLFLNLYMLPARPPLMNAVTSHLLALIGVTYEYYHLIMACLNLLIVPALIWFMRFFQTPSSRRQPWLIPMLVLLSLCPMFVQNHLYPWTKLLTGFYVILGIGLYLQGWRKKDAIRILAAMLCMATGCLVHYSAGPYWLALVGHQAFLCTRKEWPVKHWLVMLLTSFLILSTWFVWSIQQFGMVPTFASNTTITSCRH